MRLSTTRIHDRSLNSSAQFGAGVTIWESKFQMDPYIKGQLYNKMPGFIDLSHKRITSNVQKFLKLLPSVPYIPKRTPSPQKPYRLLCFPRWFDVRCGPKKWSPTISILSKYSYVHHPILHRIFYETVHAVPGFRNVRLSYTKSMRWILIHY